MTSKFIDINYKSENGMLVDAEYQHPFMCGSGARMHYAPPTGIMRISKSMFPGALKVRVVKGDCELAGSISVLVKAEDYTATFCALFNNMVRYMAELSGKPMPKPGQYLSDRLAIGVYYIGIAPKEVK